MIVRGDARVCLHCLCQISHVSNHNRILRLGVLRLSGLTRCFGLCEHFWVNDASGCGIPNVNTLYGVVGSER